MEFTPKEQQNNPLEVPYFDDVTSDGGWAGHTTSKSIKTLQSEIVQGMTRLGAMVISFDQGVYGQGSNKERDGWLLRYSKDGIPGQIKIAALPVKPLERRTTTTRKGFETRKAQSMKMALYMFARYVEGMWYAQQLSPGYLPLIPWLLGEGSGKTVSELFAERNQLTLPSSVDGDMVIDAECEEVK
jgi:hypothetical protein